ncbi:MAG: Mce-associated rane protein [Actinomycetota bacterium]|jgi:Mce-associated membrane protein|nr:Mce-associated rane protein [Actinomycetota bacterium]
MTRRPPGRLVLPGLVAVAVVAVAALVGVALLVPRVGDAAQRDARRTEVLTAARQAAVNFTTLDYRHLDRDLGRVLAGATGDFRSQFRRGSKDLRSLVSANKAVSQGEVLEAGLVSADADSARVLVVADSTVTNTASPQPRRRHYRIQLDMVRQPSAARGAAGRWLVRDLTFVG